MIQKQNQIKCGKIKESQFLMKYINEIRNDIEMYSLYNGGKSVAAERFIRTLKSRAYKYMTPVSKSVYIDKLIENGNKYNNTYYRTAKIKFVDLKDNTFVDFVKKVIIKIVNLKLEIM